MNKKEDGKEKERERARGEKEENIINKEEGVKK